MFSPTVPHLCILLPLKLSHEEREVTVLKQKDQLTKDDIWDGLGGALRKMGVRGNLFRAAWK
jgi:hypothetical protein